MLLIWLLISDVTNVTVIWDQFQVFLFITLNVSESCFCCLFTVCFGKQRVNMNMFVFLPPAERLRAIKSSTQWSHISLSLAQCCWSWSQSESDWMSPTSSWNTEHSAAPPLLLASNHRRGSVLWIWSTGNFSWFLYYQIGSLLTWTITMVTDAADLTWCGVGNVCSIKYYGDAPLSTETRVRFCLWATNRAFHLDPDPGRKFRLNSDFIHPEIRWSCLTDSVPGDPTDSSPPAPPEAADWVHKTLKFQVDISFLYHSLNNQSAVRTDNKPSGWRESDPSGNSETRHPHPVWDKWFVLQKRAAWKWNTKASETSRADRTCHRTHPQ